MQNFIDHVTIFSIDDYGYVWKIIGFWRCYSAKENPRRATSTPPVFLSWMPSQNSNSFPNEKGEKCQTILKYGMYIRLSREDGDKQESESIGNQRKILQRYVKENDLDVIKEYVDDGVSGTTFDRPSFNKMIDDIENGTINIVPSKSW